MGKRPRTDDGTPSVGLPSNFLRPCILLLIKEGSCYGYDMLEHLKLFGFHRGDPGFLYRTLRSMQRDGLIRSWWENSREGPPRRTYELTDEGEEWLHAWAGALREGMRFISRFTRRYSQAFEPQKQARS